MFLISRKLPEEDYQTEHNNNMPLNLEKPINLEMRGAESRRHSDRDSGMCSFRGARTLWVGVLGFSRGKIKPLDASDVISTYKIKIT